MNEKFKLLALEAKMGTADFDAGSYYVATPDKMQKLCELIVRECCKEITYASVGNEDPVFAYAYINHLRKTLDIDYKQ